MKCENKAAENGSVGFPEGGIYVLKKDHSYLIIDAGPNGSHKYLSHSNNDALSIEVFFGGKTFIVDPGTYCYTCDSGLYELYQSTKYHNTVQIDGLEQNRFVKNRFFKAPNFLSPRVKRVVLNEKYDFISSEHTGYSYLEKPVSHRRDILFDKAFDYFRIDDIFKGKGEHSIEWYFHLNYDVYATSFSDRVLLLRSKEGGIGLYFVYPVDIKLKIDEGFVSPFYGVKLPSKVLVFSTRIENSGTYRFYLIGQSMDDENFGEKYNGILRRQKKKI